MDNFWNTLLFGEGYKKALAWVGYIGVCVVISYASYKVLALMVGKEVVKKLVKAGIIAIA